MTTPDGTASFLYDGLGRRRAKILNGTRTDFLYDGLTPVQEISGATVTANLLTGLGVDEHFTRTTGTTVRTLLTDALGSTLALTDDTGAVLTEYTYEPFGATTETGADTNPFQYTGRENDAGTGLYAHRARYYHPGLQRFISEDPIGFAGGDVNLYAFVRNNPVTWIDPFGERWFLPRPSTGGMRGPQPRSTPMRDTSPPRFKPQPPPLPPELVPHWEQAPWWMRVLKAISDIADALQGNPPTPKTVLPPTLDGRKAPCPPPSIYEELFMDASVQRSCT
jgi:RHS repeat-associated protein